MVFEQIELPVEPDVLPHRTTQHQIPIALILLVLCVAGRELLLELGVALHELAVGSHQLRVGNEV